MKEKYCVTFAGVVGSSKSPLSYYLSQQFNLPILNNDAIRTEVIEDFLELNQEEYLKRRDQLGTELMKKGGSFIFDASVDRGWKELKEHLDRYGYEYFIVSLDLSRELIEKLYIAKGYTDSLQRLDQLILDHSQFLEQYSAEVQVHIDDKNFSDRLEIVAKSLSDWTEK